MQPAGLDKESAKNKLLYYMNEVGFVATLFRIFRKFMDLAIQKQRPSSVDVSEPLMLSNGAKFIVNPNDKGFSVDVVLGKGVQEPLVSR